MMLFFDSTSLGLFLRLTTHSVQNLPSNHSLNVGVDPDCASGGLPMPEADYASGIAELRDETRESRQLPRVLEG